MLDIQHHRTVCQLFRFIFVFVCCFAGPIQFIIFGGLFGCVNILVVRIAHINVVQSIGSCKWLLFDVDVLDSTIFGVHVAVAFCVCVVVCRLTIRISIASVSHFVILIVVFVVGQNINKRNERSTLPQQQQQQQQEQRTEINQKRQNEKSKRKKLRKFRVDFVCYRRKR